MNLDLALYIHFPWCVQKCPYCDFNSHALQGRIPEELYIEALLRDLEHDRPWVKNREISSIFCGGGTPSLFSGKAIAQLLQAVEQAIPFKKNLEITLEANPGTLKAEDLDELRAGGVNRLSLGAQSFQAQQLKALGRIHGPEEIYQAVDNAKVAGFDNFNIDLMYGLSEQTVEDALYDLKQAFSLSPTHLSWYQLTLEPNTPFYRTPPPLPLEDELAKMCSAGETYLKQQGYDRYEISAYSRSHQRCQHNMNYWQYGDYLGVGAGAHGKITLADGTVLRTAKKKHPKQYLSATDFLQEQKTLTAKDLQFEFMLNALRLMEPIAWSLFEKHTQSFRASILPLMDNLVNKELLNYNQDSFYLTDLGRRFSNEIMAEFLPE